MRCTEGSRLRTERKAARRRCGLLLATIKPRAEARLQEVTVSGREEVEVTSLSDSRSLVVRKKRNKVFVQKSSKETGRFWKVN